MDANSPNAGDDSMHEHQIDGQRNKKATSKYWNSLYEGINRMKSKSRIGCDAFRLMMNEVQFVVNGRMMQDSMCPIGQKLVIKDVEQEIGWEHVSEIPVILHFGVVRIAHLNQSDQGSLANNINERPFDVEQFLLLVVPMLIHLGSKLHVPNLIKDEIGKRAQSQVEENGKNQCQQTG